MNYFIHTLPFILSFEGCDQKSIFTGLHSMTVD